MPYYVNHNKYKKRYNINFFQKNQLICRNKNIICNNKKVIQKGGEMGNDKG